MHNNDKFFQKENCDRCHGELKVRTTSWFNRDTICLNCSLWEDKIIRNCETSKSDLEGIGNIPEVDFKINWGTDPDE